MLQGAFQSALPQVAHLTLRFAEVIFHLTVRVAAVILVARHGIKGGETRVFQADGPLGMRFVIDKPWSALLLDDAHVIHGTTPIQPEAQASPATASAAGRERSAPSDPDDPVAPPAVRDTLVLTYRRGGFQSSA